MITLENHMVFKMINQVDNVECINFPSVLNIHNFHISIYGKYMQKLYKRTQNLFSLLRKGFPVCRWLSTILLLRPGSSQTQRSACLCPKTHAANA